MNQVKNIKDSARMKIMIPEISVYVFGGVLIYSIY